MTHLTEMVAKMICSPPPGQLERFPETPGSCQSPAFHLSWVQTQRLLQRTKNLPPLSLFVWQPSPLLSQPTWPSSSLTPLCGQPYFKSLSLPINKFQKINQISCRSESSNISL